MAKHSQTKSWQQPMNCLSVSDHFVELALNGLTNTIKQEYVDVHCRDDDLSKSDYKGGFSYNDRKKWKNENEKKTTSTHWKCSNFTPFIYTHTK